MLSTQFLHCDLVCINVVQGRGLVCFLLDILVFSIALHFCSVLLNDWLCRQACQTLLVMTIVILHVYRNVWWPFFVSWCVTVADEKGQHNTEIEPTRKLFVLLEFLSESSFSEFEWRSFDVWMSSLLREGWSDKVHKLFSTQIKTINNQFTWCLPVALWWSTVYIFFHWISRLYILLVGVEILWNLRIKVIHILTFTSRTFFYISSYSTIFKVFCLVWGLLPLV